MTVGDWEILLSELSMAGGALYPDRNLFYRHFALLNRLNAGNPKWTPYKIPEAIPE